jgi:hypothetical protein
VAAARHGTAAAAAAAAFADDDMKRPLHERAIEAIRIAAEASSPTSFVLVLALAGGTGSGLGARLLESIRDAYPRHHIVAIVVAPFEDGENPMQSYNSVLCVRSLQQHADAVLLYRNDDAATEASQLASRFARSASSSAGGMRRGPASNDTARISLDRCNDVIAASAAGALAPVVDAAGRNSAAREARLWEVVTAVAPAPSWKLLRAVSATPSPGSAEAVGAVATATHDAIRTLPRFDEQRARVRTLAAQLTVSWARGAPQPRGRSSRVLLAFLS